MDRPWMLDYLRQRFRKNITDSMNSWSLRVFLNSLEYRHTFEAHCRSCWKGFLCQEEIWTQSLESNVYVSNFVFTKSEGKDFLILSKKCPRPYCSLPLKCLCGFRSAKNQRESLLTARLCRSKGQNNRCPLHWKALGKLVIIWLEHAATRWQ